MNWQTLEQQHALCVDVQLCQTWAVDEVQDGFRPPAGTRENSGFRHKRIGCILLAIINNCDRLPLRSHINA